MEQLDPLHDVQRKTPLIWIGCDLELRQLARQLLAKRFVEDGEGSRDTLFPDLQWRYPTAHSADAEEPEYILRDVMSNEDVAYNVARLRAEASAKMVHAESLEKWGKYRR